MATALERWRLHHEGREHVVEIGASGLRRTVVWRLDGATVATRKTTDARVVLDGGDRGAVGVRLPEFVGPARRVTWHSPDQPLGAQVAAHAGVGGLDLTPEPGSKAAARQAWIRAHPRLHVARRTALAALGVLLPLLGAWLLNHLHVPWPAVSFPWPDWDLPSIPWPRLPWPDLTVPWPHWQLPELPAWMTTLREAARYAWPVVLAFAVAHAEVKRRRRQDERRAEAHARRDRDA